MTYARAPQNQPRFCVQTRERERRVHNIWNSRDGGSTGRRVTEAWTPWRTLVQEHHEDTARATAEALRRNNSLRQVRIVFGGKVLPVNAPVLERVQLAEALLEGTSKKAVPR